MAAIGAVALSACAEPSAQSQPGASTTASAASIPTTTTTPTAPTLTDALFGKYSVRVPEGWTASSDVGDLGARAIWSDPTDPDYRVTVTSGPAKNYWNHELGRWRGDLPGFPEGDAKRVTPRYLQYPPMMVDDLATTRALVVDRTASQWIELTADFPVAWQPQADEIMTRTADCIIGRGPCAPAPAPTPPG
jgi:hypothetical protein